MVILMLLEHDFPGDVRVDKEVQSLSEAGHKVIVASSTGGHSKLFEQRNNCKIYRKKISPFILKSSVGALTFPFYFNFWRSFIKDILRKESVDAIHVHDLPLAKVGLELKKRKKVKLVIDLHENWPALLEISQHTKTLIGRLLSSNKQWRKYEAEMANKADAIIAVVQEMKERLCNLKIDPTKIYVVENLPNNFGDTITKNVDNEFFTLLYIGGVTEARGLQYVLEGMAILNNNSKKIRLWIVGDGRYLSTLKKTSAELGIDNVVTFFGKVSSNEVQKYLSKTDVALVPHVRSEQSDNSSPNKLFEYMSAGIPVLSSNCKSIVRIVSETETGITYVYNSPDDFAKKVNLLIDNSDKLSIYSRNGVDAIKNKYNWETTSKNLVDLYNYIAQ